MTPNEDILRVFQELPDNKRAELQQLIYEYKYACRLSQRLRPDQLHSWKKRALALEHELREFLDLD
jgi:hypothetical protein